MGVYLNPGTEMFSESLRSEIYIDKTGLIACSNKSVGHQEEICLRVPSKAVW